MSVINIISVTYNIIVMWSEIHFLWAFSQITIFG